MTGNGGAGGKGGNVDLEASGGSIQVAYYLNASGGGGGGGAGANEQVGVGVGTAGSGGAAGGAGQVVIKASGSYFAGQPIGYSVLDFDGAAGGKGGAAAGVAGGGGGGGTSFGGGGGGGAAGIGVSGAVGGGGAGTYVVGSGGGGAGSDLNNTATQLLGGGGGSAVATNGSTNQFSSSNLFGTAGTAGAGAGTGSGAKNGAAGSISYFNSSGNLVFGVTGGNAGGYVPPVSPSTVPALGGAGGALDAPGTGGASGLTSPTNFGSTGGNTTTEFGAGSVNLTVGAATGSAKAPVVIDTPTLTLTGTTKAASIYDASGGQSVNLLSANMFSGSTLSIIESHNILTVSGPITGASTVLLDGWGGVTVKGAITADKLVSIVAGQTPFSSAPSGIGGDITGSALITAPTVNLTALRGVSADGTKLGLVGGNITANTTATTISANGQGSIVATAATPGVNLTINPTAGKTTTISTGSSGSAFNLNILGGQTVVDSKVITASNMTITTSGAVGTAAKPFLTNVGGTLTVNGSSLAPVYLKDSGLVSLILAGSGAAGESINLVSAAKTLTLNSLGYGDVTISDTYATAGKSAQVLIAAGANVGNGFGVVSISAAAADINEGVAAGIAGTDVILSSKAGNIGATGTINVATPLLSANAAKGKVDITDSVAVTLSAGTALSSYDVSAYGITVNGAINGGTIALNGTGAGPVVLDANVGGTKSTSVAITSGAGITQNAKAVISGLAIVLDGGAGDIGTLTQSVFTKATNTLAINDGTGRTANVNQNGKALLIASAAGGASTLNLVDASALIVDGVVSYGATNITAPSVTVDKTGLIAGASATIIAPVVSIDTGSGVAGISLTGSAIFLSSTTLTINGDGSITPGTQLVLGGKVNGKSTTAITLGDAKTGNGNPLDASFKGVNVTSLTINTTGNFTSAETGITVATDTFGNGGTIDLTAKNIVIAGSSQAPYPPFMLNANGAAGKDGGYINFNLTGTQNVTVGNGAGSAKTGPNYEFIVNGGVNGNAGSISVASGGVLSVSSVGINLVTSAGGGSLTLSGAKGLAVLDDVFNGGNSYSLVSLTSGATTAFTIGTPTTINGVSSSINAFNVSITASGPIVVNGSGPQIIASADTAILNPTGALVITGPGSITPGSSLALTGKSGVTLGDAKTGLGNPLSNIGLNSLDSLLVNAGKGNFTSPINSFTLANGGTGGVLSITAANMVVSGGGAKQISLTAGSANGNAGSVTLNLTGTQALTLDANQGTLKAPTYVISNIGGGTGGAITVQSGGALIDNLNGVLLNAGSNLTLNGVKSLAVNDSVLVSSGNINSLTLVSGATGAFVVGVAPSANGVNAGVNGINAGTVSITDGAGIIVNNNIQATNANADVVFNTKAFTNNATIQANSGNTTISFGVAGLSGASNGIVFNASSGSFFGGFSNTIINATGAVKLGPLFSGPTAYLSGINFLSISTPGAVTVNANGSGTPTIDIGAGATLQIYAGSLVSAASAPITITPTTNTALITIDTKAALTIGTAKGNIALPTGLASANLTSNGGVLTVNTAINASNVSLVGTSVTVAQSVNASGNLSVAATSSSGSITTVNSAALNANAIQIGDMNTKLSATPINVSAVTVSVGGLVVPGLAPMTGALSINNTYSAAPTSLIGSSLAALNYTGSD
ncbi:MAG: hypothetical protein KGS72_28770, partial [Cyanobacteria bacterium REEB67]|nr:hypothetical protein [Cyanobacteria bacterium REEB67]